MLVNKKLIPFVAGTLSAVMLPAAIAPMLIGDRGAGFDAAVVAAEPPAQSFAKSVKYEPPNRGTPRRTLGSGSRSPDANAQPVALTLLVPNDHTGLTVSGRSYFLLASEPRCECHPGVFAGGRRRSRTNLGRAGF
ncbi:MAG: hypothetical protein HC925_07280 [Coleofasciculaceae cyanobacterium SM2_3_26]|nr:hypothetical protein [Coleofasciculaceae cyanobacterium SM2_3_26]